MKGNRSIPVKANVTVDQYIDLVADAQTANKSVSTLLRDCWLKCRNGKSARARVARPSLVPFQAKFAPGRMARPAVYMRS